MRRRIGQRHLYEVKLDWPGSIAEYSAAPQRLQH
jgi:hypothetical protein